MNKIIVIIGLIILGVSGNYTWKYAQAYNYDTKLAKILNPYWYNSSYADNPGYTPLYQEQQQNDLIYTMLSGAVGIAGLAIILYGFTRESYRPDDNSGQGAGDLMPDFDPNSPTVSNKPSQSNKEIELPDF